MVNLAAYDPAIHGISQIEGYFQTRSIKQLLAGMYLPTVFFTCQLCASPKKVGCHHGDEPHIRMVIQLPSGKLT